MEGKVNGDKRTPQEVAARLLTVKDAAQYLSISSKTLWLWTREGKIPTVQIGPKTRLKYDRRDLDNIIDDSKSLSRPSQVLQSLRYNLRN